MKTNENFGVLIRSLREASGFPIRKVAAAIDIDASTLSKIERNERPASRELVGRLAKALQVNEHDLLVSYLSDKVLYELQDESVREQVLKAAEQKIKYLARKKK